MYIIAVSVSVNFFSLKRELYLCGTEGCSTTKPPVAAVATRSRVSLSTLTNSGTFAHLYHFHLPPFLAVSLPNDSTAIYLQLVYVCIDSRYSSGGGRPTNVWRVFMCPPSHEENQQRTKPITTNRSLPNERRLAIPFRNECTR